jgi:hypothetical protein
MGRWASESDSKRYVVLYDGDGELDFWLTKPSNILRSKGRIEFDYDASKHLGLTIKSTSPTNHIRNIRVVPLDSETNFMTQPFRSEFTRLWEGVSVMRYLKPQKISNSTKVVWSDRHKPSTFGGLTGMALEHIVEYSNATNTNPWILMPHLADDTFFRKAAWYVKKNLNPNLKVYLEYTNEPWNYALKQTHYFKERGEENDTHRLTEYSKRAARLFEIWSRVFKHDERLITVVNTQFWSPRSAQIVLETPELLGKVDALAVGYYIGALNKRGSNADDLYKSNDQVIDELFEELEIKGKLTIQKNKEVADKYNVDLIAYEAGQHLQASGGFRRQDPKNWQKLVDKYIQINRSPRMYDLYLKMNQTWQEAGGGLIVWFETTYPSDKSGSWGLLETMSQDPSSAPKYRAIKKIIEQQGC